MMNFFFSTFKKFCSCRGIVIFLKVARKFSSVCVFEDQFCRFLGYLEVYCGWYKYGCEVEHETKLWMIFVRKQSSCIHSSLYTGMFCQFSVFKYLKSFFKMCQTA